MSKTLPPKINLREGREEGGRKRERRGGRRRTGSSLSAGTEGERVSVSMELKLRNCEQERAPRWPRNDPSACSEDPGPFSSCSPAAPRTRGRSGQSFQTCCAEMRAPVMSGSVLPCPSANTSHIFRHPGCDPSACTVSTFAPNCAKRGAASSSLWFFFLF